MSESQSKPSRRGFMLGAAVAGAAATAVVTLPKTEGTETPTAEKTPPAPERGGGYRLSEHVKQYYKTTLI
jgi:TAT (twin-arginine translocation) pathway signal sequence